MVAAYGDTGSIATASSRNGAGVLSPYTEDDEPNTIRDTPAPPRRLGDRRGPGDIGAGIAHRVRQRRPHPGLGGQVDDDGVGSKVGTQRVGVEQVLLVEA